MTRIIIPGTRVTDRGQRLESLADFGLQVTTIEAAQVAATRDAADTVEFKRVPADRVIELQLADGLIEWVRADALSARLSPAEPERDMGPDGRGAVVIPTALPATTATRGATESALVVEGVRALDVSLPEALADATAPEIVRFFEDRLYEKNGLPPGTAVYRVAASGRLEQTPIEAELPATDRPYLVLIHGTFSNTRGGFHTLFGTPEWDDLARRYDGRILALEHRTLSESPARNALALLKVLPLNARLHLITHSRGGLVGEALALKRLARSELAALRAAPDHADMADDLRELIQLIAQKRPVIERYVRAACPALGTKLNSERFDVFMSVLVNLMGLIPGLRGNPIFDFVRATALALINKRADPMDLPGLACMTPDAPFIALLNRARTASDADLACIAGDVQPDGGVLERLKLMALDVFFGEPHDLVVNTAAMFDGVPRSGRRFVSFEQGPNITHSNYFSNPASRARIHAWLIAHPGEVVDGFEERVAGAEPRPIVTRGEEEMTVAVITNVTRKAVSALKGESMPLHVSVRHGSLEFAEHPVMVGHYQGDLIVSSESFLNRRLDHRLSKRLAMGLYPGAPGTCEVVLTPGNNPPGGIVVGLGDVGELTTEALTNSVMHAALRYALTVADGAAKASEAGKRSRWRSAAFSAVLIGTSTGQSLTIESAVASIVKGALLANRRLRDQGVWDQVRIDQIEFIELYEDLAIRAARAARDLASIHLRMDLEDGEEIASEKLLGTVEGGMPGQPTSEYASGWWRRLQITMPKDEQGNESGALRYVVLTDRARAEEVLQATQRRLVDKLVEQTIHLAGDTKNLPATLYELLVPNLLKDRAQERADLLLVLDRHSARYPWEMLAQRQAETGHAPISLEVGLLRQLKVNRFRERVQQPRGAYALVVGDPDLVGNPRFLQLDGARDEARRVSAMLGAHNYIVTSKINKGALDILHALFAQEYTIIHIAGHGVFDAQHPERSGVVLGDGMFLGATEIGQLRVVPRLVFLNCCHLAKLEGGAEGDAKQREALRDHNLLAASIAEQLIQIGVQVVVAAGWAVNDAAAAAFAEVFYEGLLSDDSPNRQLGGVVQRVRERIAKDFGHVNTWGAYQVYGDPGFTLNAGQAQASSRPRAYVAPREVVRELERIRISAPDEDGAQKQVNLKRVRGIFDHLQEEERREWLNDGRMWYEFGATYAELGDFDQAIKAYENAIHAKSASGEVPIRAIEQLANLQARYAMQLRQTSKAGQQPEQIKDLQARLHLANARLCWLIELSPSPERRALVAGIYKRMALAAPDDTQRRDFLGQAAQQYHLATQDNLDPYPGLNTAVCEWLGMPARKTKATRRIMADLTRWHKATRAYAAKKNDFWARIMLPEAELLLRLVDGSLVKHEKAITQAYTQALSGRGSARERASVREQFDFLEEMLRWRRQAKLADHVARVRQMTWEQA